MATIGSAWDWMLLPFVFGLRLGTFSGLCIRRYFDRWFFTLQQEASIIYQQPTKPNTVQYQKYLTKRTRQKSLISPAFPQYS
jgi:hypothetical protein